MRTLPDTITEQRIGNRLVRRDEGGYLVDPDDWSETAALEIAGEEGVQLTDAH